MKNNPANTRGLGLVVLLICLAVGALLVPANGQTPNPTPTATATPTPNVTPSPTPTPTPTATPSPTPSPTPKVTGVKGELALYNTISVAVADLDNYMKEKDITKMVLYLDWRPIRGLKTRLDPDNKALLFDIDRYVDATRDPDGKSQKEWDALLGRPFLPPKSFTYKVPVSIGYDNDPPLLTDVDNDKKYSLVVVNKWGFWIFAVLFLGSLAGFWWLANHSGIVRDTCNLPFKKRPFSLGRVQMAFWFYVVAVSYSLIWLITSNRDSLTASALALIGISAATALGATAISRSKASAETTRKHDLELEKDTVIKRLAELDAKIAAGPTPSELTALENERVQKRARLEQIEQELPTVAVVKPPQESEGFFWDIMSDANDISLHRFQMAIWTAILGIVFIASVYNSLAMPEFSSTLLALMGVSGGTYIGFKFPEAQN